MVVHGSVCLWYSAVSVWPTVFSVSIGFCDEREGIQLVMRSTCDRTISCRSCTSLGSADSCDLDVATLRCSHSRSIRISGGAFRLSEE